MNKEKVLQWSAIAVIGVLALVGLYKSPVKKLPSSYGTTTGGNMLAEQYIPYVLYNGGYNTAKDINTSSFLGGTGTFQFGSAGTTFTRDNSGTCYFIPTATTIVASTTQTVDCQATAAVGNPNATGSALAGVTSGDVVQIQLSTSTASYNSTTLTNAPQGLTVVGASASTTAGYISVRLFNGFGTTYTWPVGVIGGVNASGTASYFIRK